MSTDKYFGFDSVLSNKIRPKIPVNMKTSHESNKKCKYGTLEKYNNKFYKINQI